MSAIFGIYYLSGKPVSPRLLKEMSAILEHRGSDSAGIWSESDVGLGHRISATTPEAEFEIFPLDGENSATIITADARLDNRAELIEMFAPGKSDSSVTDSELIVAAYENWGENCAKHLLGDFAFAIWDSRRKQLFCARDCFGIKPFYYHLSENLFAFATEIKALLLLPEVSRRINESKVADFLNSTFGRKDITFYEDVFRLLPANAATVSRAGVKIFSYWDLKLPSELKLKSDNEYAEALREHFTEAVRTRLRSNLPVGTMLSGGIDSSSITCTARKLLANEKTKRLHTFSAVFDQVKECDEREYINAVIRDNNVSPHFIVADNYGPFADFEKIVQVLDEPLLQSNFYLNWLSYKAAQSQGIKVILDGYDGDSTVSHGLGFFIELARQKRWAKLLSENIAYAKKINQPWQQSAWSWIWGFGLNPWMSRNRIASHARNGIRRLKRNTKSDGKAAMMSVQPSGVDLNPNFAKRVNPAGIAKQKAFVPQTERENHLYNLTGNGNPSSSLEVLDYASGAFSIEMRFPFWDRRLVEFCLSLPPEQKINKGWTRMVMRRAMEGILPPEIQWRPGKSDLAPSFNYGLLKFGRQLMENFIVKNPETIVEYVDIKSLREAYGRFLKSEASVNDTLSIQHCVSLALWLQKQANVQN